MPSKSSCLLSDTYSQCGAVDHDNNDLPVFESGAVMMYLAEKAGKLYPSEWNKRTEVNQWMFFMNAGVMLHHCCT